MKSEEVMGGREARGNTENPPVQGGTGGLPQKGLERREVEKRIYAERKRLTASATFLSIRYLRVLNAQ